MNKLRYVNIKQGTASLPQFSSGNTLPLTQLPFGMASFAPQTATGVWYYHPTHRSLYGIRLTHQPSPWIRDYGAFLFTPKTETPNDFVAWSGFRPENAILKPHYQKFTFLQHRTDMEVTPVTRGGVFRTVKSDSLDTWFSVLPVDGDFNCKIDFDRGLAFCDSNFFSMGVAENFRTYCVIKFPKNSVDPQKSVTSEGGLHLFLKEIRTEMQVAISYISYEQAETNLENISFDKAVENAEKQWEERLSTIEIEADEKTLKTFYSCLYRTFLFPHKAYEISKNGKEIHYAPSDGKVYFGKRYTDNGFWDTYRTVFPLFSIIAKQDYAEMLDGFVADYREGGWLPRWPSIGEVGCMPSTLIDAVIADAAVKGIADKELLQTALCGMLHHATTDADDKRYGRNGATAYKKYGYVPFDLERESVNLTLDAAYGDFCIAETAKVLGKREIEEEYRPLSKNYANIFDRESGFMRARDTSGKMADEFDPFSWGNPYTEGSAWQNSFTVPHDIKGLAGLYGGKENLIKKLDELFATPPIYRTGAYGGEIHEMTEMAAVDFGQCAISNQPSFHIPYIYAELGETEKTVYWVDKICRELFSGEDDGFPGDEDNGSMSAWYIFGVLGFYPFCPGKAEFTGLGRALAKNIKIMGKPFDPKKFGNKIDYNAFL